MKVESVSMAIQGMINLFLVLRSPTTVAFATRAAFSTTSSISLSSRTSFNSFTKSFMTSKDEEESTQPPAATTTDLKEEEIMEAYKNENNLDDQIVSAISANGEIKVTACTVRNIINDVMIEQTLTATPANALARSMACGLLLSNGMQKEQTFQLTMACDGPIRSVMAIADGAGKVKGFVGNPALSDMHISEAIGRGTVQVVKMHPEWSVPYNGITAIEHGDIDRDVGIYLAESEQRACALAAAAKFNGILCTAAGGYIVEQLPGCTEETMQKVEENLSKLVAMNGAEKDLPAGILLDGKSPIDICATALEGLGIQPLQQIQPGLTCECSEERLFRAVRLLPREEIDKILEEDEKLEARCHFCGKVYYMDAEAVAKKFEEATGDPALDDDFKG